MYQFFELTIGKENEKLRRMLGVKTIDVKDESHEYAVDVSKHDYDPSRIEFTFIDLTEELPTPF